MNDRLPLPLLGLLLLAPVSAGGEVPIVYHLPFPAGQTYRVLETPKEGTPRRAVFACPKGTPVLAARNGTIVDLQMDSHEGGPDPSFVARINRIIVDHEDGTLGVYGHLAPDSARVDFGDRVLAGDTLAESGWTGQASEPMLAFHVENADTRAQVPFSFAELRRLEVGDEVTSRNVPIRAIRKVQEALELFQMACRYRDAGEPGLAVEPLGKLAKVKVKVPLEEVPRGAALLAEIEAEAEEQLASIQAYDDLLSAEGAARLRFGADDLGKLKLGREYRAELKKRAAADGFDELQAASDPRDAYRKALVRAVEAERDGKQDRAAAACREAQAAWPEAPDADFLEMWLAELEEER